MNRFLTICFSVLLIETLLRGQQWLGPIVDLNPVAPTETLSETLNHRPKVGVFQQEWQESRYQKEYDSHGIRMNHLRPQNGPKKVLFLGDSFMEGFEDSLTLPQMLWEKSQQFPQRDSYAFLNAGHSSYAPSIYTVQLKQLTEIVRPDFIVIAIDETDLGDDFLRYKRLTVRDEKGQMTSVRSTPETKIFLEGLAALKDNPSYLGRLAQKFYHLKIRMPKVNQDQFPKRLSEVLKYSDVSIEEAQLEFPEAIAYFESTITQLVQQAIASVGSASQVLLIKHPHLGNLYGERSDLISKIVQTQCERHGVNYIDVKKGMRLAFGETPERFFFSNDIHFNREGFEIYADLVAKKLLPMLFPYSPTAIVEDIS